MVTKRCCYLYERSCILADNENCWIHDEHFTDCVCHPFYCCHRRLIYAELMAMEDILYVYKTDATDIQIMPEHHILILLPLPSDSNGDEPAKFF